MLFDLGIIVIYVLRVLEFLLNYGKYGILILEIIYRDVKLRNILINGNF